MNYILETKEYNGMTRIYFGYQISSYSMANLLSIFNPKKLDFNLIENETAIVKLLDVEDKTSIEITNEYISFFPILKDDAKQETKKKIYNIVARRSEVYFKSATENLEGAKYSLLKSDFRSSTSLMYYCLHKFMSGRFYKLVNSNLNILDIDIKESDIGHYTSEMFSKIFHDLGNECIELNSDNYIDVMKTSKSKQLNPFLVAKYDLVQTNLNTSELDALLNNICTELFEKNFAGHSTIYFDKFVNEFHKIPKKKQTQDLQVTAAIAYCFMKLKEEESVIWKFSILTLRLYWLRQNADYDYDFEVKVSVRELCLIFSSIQSFCNELNIENVEDEEEKNVNQAIISDDEVKNKELNTDLQNVKSINKYYRVDYEFNNLAKENPTIYMICLHLDSEFEQSKSLYVLNMMPEVLNRGKYFLFEKDSLPFSMNLHISNEGKWTFWFPQDYNDIEIRREEDLLKCVEAFYKEFVKTGDKIEVEISLNLLKAFPIITKESSEMSSFTLLKQEKARTLSISNHYLNDGLDALSEIFKDKKIYLGDDDFQLVVDIRYFNEDHYYLELPVESFFERNIFERDKQYSIICFYLYENEENERKVYRRSRSVKSFANNKLKKIDKQLMSVEYIPLSIFEFENFAELNQISNSIIIKILDEINNLLYKMTTDGRLDFVGEFLNNIDDAILSLSPYLLATKGLYYLRNADFNAEESLTNGRTLYEKAIEEIHKQNPEMLNAFKLKLHLELTRFALFRLKDLEMATKEKEKFYSVEISDDFESLNEFFQEMQSLEKELAIVATELNL